MSMWQFMTDNIDGIVKPLMKYPGYPAEYDYDPDPQVTGALAMWLVDNTDASVLFDDLIQYHGHEIIGMKIMDWYCIHMNAKADAFTDGNLRTFLTEQLFNYAESLLNDKSDDLISYYVSMQKEQHND